MHGEGEKQKKGEEKENQQVLDDGPAPDSQDQKASEAKLQKRPLLKPQFIFKKSKSGKKGKKYLDSSFSDVEMAIQGKPIIKRKVPDFVDGINPILSSVQGSVAPKGPVAGELLTSTIHPQVHFEATASRQEKQPAAPISKEASVRPQVREEKVCFFGSFFLILFSCFFFGLLHSKKDKNKILPTICQINL